MTRLVTWLLIALQPVPVVVRDQVDRIEVNHVYDRQGQLSFSQVILWEDGHVRAWRRVCTAGKPIRTAHGWRLRWSDAGTLRQVDAMHASESWTQHDPERDDLQAVRQEQRWPLTPERSDGPRPR